VFDSPFADQLGEYGFGHVFCSPDEAVLRGHRFRAVMLVGESSEDVVPTLVKLRSQPSTVLMPILVALRKGTRASHRLIAPVWRSYADALLEGEAEVWQAESSLTLLRQIDARGHWLEPIDERVSEVERRRLTLLRFLFTRQRDALEPVRDPSSRSGWAYPPLDLLGELEADLEALVAGRYLERLLLDRLSTCRRCGDARLLFREVCAACRSPNVERGEMLHHYACGHVQAESAFRRGERLVCPSCGLGLRQVGVDYERPASLLECVACEYVAADGLTEARCLGCGQSSLAEEVGSHAIYKYVLTSAGQAGAQKDSLPPLAAPQGRADGVAGGLEPF
jgi:hypothetical protein